MDADAAAAWERIQRELRDAVPTPAYDVWLRGLELHELDVGHLVLVAPDHAARWIADRFSRVLQTTASAVLGSAVDVDVLARSALARRRSPDSATSREGALNPDYTFEEFVIGEGNRLAHAAALAVAEQPGATYNPLFICGPPGVGKTHLLHSIAAYLRSHGATGVQCVTADAFTTAFVQAVQTSTVDAFKARYRRADVLLVDDVQFLEDKARTEEELFHTFNAMHESGRQLVFTSDRAPRDITALEERLRERFESGLVAEIAVPDFQTRLTILTRWVREQTRWEIGRDVLEAIAGQTTGNVRALKGLLIRVVAEGSIGQSPIDGALVERVLARLRGGRRRVAPSVDEVQDVVCAAFGLTVEELVSSSRSARLAWPRQLAMYLARTEGRATLPAIGRSFGGRDHSTVAHACERVKRKLATEDTARAEAARLVALLQRPGGDR